MEDPVAQNQAITQLIDDLTALDLTAITNPNIQKGLAEMRELSISALCGSLGSSKQLMSSHIIPTIAMTVVAIERMRKRGTVPPSWESTLTKMDGLLDRLEKMSRENGVALRISFGSTAEGKPAPIRFGKPTR
ncbi:MAG: hypothetical protein EBR79_01180 [Proteobacteria bacterium]|nr:hypothetical protein [Pseudomonadota bacterium]NBX86700.1 hypothetical protein [Pseudomonadota bacterium]